MELFSRRKWLRVRPCTSSALQDFRPNTSKSVKSVSFGELHGLNCQLPGASERGRMLRLRWIVLRTIAGLVHVPFPGVIQRASQFEESRSSTG
jgi:hypothetical protein